MSGGSWKVAYADFMTAMMAFFLLMWVLNMAPKDTVKYLAGYFTAGGNIDTGQSSPEGNSPLTQVMSRLDKREFRLNEAEKSHYAIASDIKQFLLADALPSTSSGISSSSVGVLLHVNSDAMFQPNSVTLTPQGMQVIDDVIKVMKKYKVFLVVRGHASRDETGAPDYPSKWELSSARATSAVRYILDKGGVDPTYVRSVGYADSRPCVPYKDDNPETSKQNRRVEFYFHRPEVMSTIVGY